ncbi:DNA topoisomerase IV subunit A [Mycoplasmoides alvi]|uniref:DNA topoisomerase IV subunit A n=1 Tax=Mycoplasmoides alvi TaxID=78580 RepID=UPI000696D39C|nr:DNA topoisomerase IV subunit A [Mycoplasmoides alvi]
MNNKIYQKIQKKEFDEIMSDSFGKYAKYIIQDRALPDIRDGLKPVQRRILYAMYKIGLNPEKAHKKSATTVGEVIGKYHPHGDSSIYEALVRMSQWWKNNIPLVDMQGNNGSIDGDSAAAMRYTEAKFSTYGFSMMNQIEKETVKFVFNFDDTEYEPTLLPTLLPNLFINGATGIAAGYATNIPPFNINELIDAIIMKIDSPNCRLDSLIKVLPGPDFPTGGIICDDNGIKESYETGKGKFILRAKIDNEIVNNKMQLVISEIPYETNKSSIIKSIEEIIDNQEIAYLNEVRDESDKNGIRIVLEYKGDEKIADTIKRYLFKNTQLQITYNINNITIYNRKPIQTTLINYLDSYLEHAMEIIIKSSVFDLNKTKNRLEIIEGLIKTTSIIDKIIELIRLSKDKTSAISGLMEKFAFTNNQAEAIVQLRLYRLTNTDVLGLQEEFKTLNETIIELNKILNDEQYRKHYLKGILRNYKKIFNNPRKTKIEKGVEKIVISDVDIIENKDINVVISRNGYIKYTTQKIDNLNTLCNLKMKENDTLVFVSNAQVLDRILIITSFGNFICLPIHKIKEGKIRELGNHINNIVTLRDNEKIIFAKVLKDNLNVENNLSIVLVSKYGMVKRFYIRDVLNCKIIKPSICMNLKENDILVDAKLVCGENQQIILYSQLGNALRFNIDEISVIGLKGMGVRGIKLRNEDFLINCSIIEPENENYVVLFASNGIKRIAIKDLITLSRATMGKPILNQIKSKPYKLVSAILIDGKQKNIICYQENSEEPKIISVNQIPLLDFDSRMSSPILESLIFAYLPDKEMDQFKNE